METGGPFRFAATARALAHEARRLGLVAPSFRTPPRVAGVDRTLRGARSGSPVVSVRLQSRPFAAVVADLVEGVVVTNGLAPAEAARARAALWDAARACDDGVAPPAAVEAA